MKDDNTPIVPQNLLSMENNRTENNRTGLKENVLEVLVFCFLIIPSLAFSFVAGPMAHMNFAVGVLGVMFSDLALVFLVLFFLWHNAEKVSRIGWVSRGFVREAVLGAVLFVPTALVLFVVQSWLQSKGLPFPRGHIPSFLEPTQTSQRIVLTFLIIIVAISEETIFRGYLILRFKAITRSSASAVILSTIIFSIGHGYEGVGGVIVVGMLGFFFALIYLWRKSLVAPMVMHFLQDFIAVVFVSIMLNK